MLALPEFVLNPEPRCPCVVLGDASYSMLKEPIAALNNGLKVFGDEVRRDPVARMRAEISVVAFGGDVRLEQDFVTVDDYQPRLLTADGGTPMGEAIIKGIDILEVRKQFLRDSGVPYYRPWIILISDGAPTDDWENARRLVHEGERDGRFSFFAVGVKDADMDRLRQIAPPNRPPLKLDGLKFAEFFVWLSHSIRRASCSRLGGQQTALPPVDGWAQINP